MESPNLSEGRQGFANSRRAEKAARLVYGYTEVRPGPEINQPMNMTLEGINSRACDHYLSEL